MKLQAVTICINYSDYLEVTAENRRHFDRWVVMTVKEDTRTRFVCDRYGIECRDSVHFHPRGAGFNVRWNKSPIINEGLDFLDPDVWYLLIDSDVLLPRDFRRRLEGLPLERDCLYGVTGRKICGDREIFNLLRRSEPWDGYARRNSQAIGYFNLFHASNSQNRYIVDFDRYRSLLDDDIFCASVSPEKRRLLPMTVIHTGAIERNWDGRIAAPYRTECDFDFESRLASPFIEAITATGHSQKTAAIVGYFPGGLWQEIAEFFETTYLFDQYLVHVEAADPIVEADRAVLRKLTNEALDRSRNVIFAGAHSQKSLEKLPADSIDLLFLPSDSLAMWLLPAFQFWEKKLRAGAIICGDVFGLPGALESTSVINICFGVPNHVTRDGFWWRYWLPKGKDGVGSAGVVHSVGINQVVTVVSYGLERQEALFLTLYSIRKYWDGPISLFHWGPSDLPLRAACYVLNAELEEIGGDSIDDSIEATYAWLMEQSVLAQRACYALVLAPGTIALRDICLDGYINFPGTPPRGIFPRLSILSSRENELRAVEAESATAFHSASRDAMLLVCDGDPQTWTPEAWNTWSELKVEMLLRFRVEIPVPKDATVVTILTAEFIGLFEQHWLTWHFAPDTPTVVVLIDVDSNEIWFPGSREPTVILQADLPQIDNPLAVLTRLVEVCESEWLVFLPPSVAALPGAQLLMPEWDHLDAVIFSSSAALQEERTTGNIFVPIEFTGAIKKDFARRLALEPRTPRVGHLGVQIRLLIDQVGAKWMAIDPRSRGWVLPEESRYVRRS